MPWLVVLLRTACTSRAIAAQAPSTALYPTCPEHHGRSPVLSPTQGWRLRWPRALRQQAGRCPRPPPCSTPPPRTSPPPAAATVCGGVQEGAAQVAARAGGVARAVAGAGAAVRAAPASPRGPGPVLGVGARRARVVQLAQHHNRQDVARLRPPRLHVRPPAHALRMLTHYTPSMHAAVGVNHACAATSPAATTGHPGSSGAIYVHKGGMLCGLCTLRYLTSTQRMRACCDWSAWPLPTSPATAMC